jgi:hypothetical protein
MPNRPWQGTRSHWFAEICNQGTVNRSCTTKTISTHVMPLPKSSMSPPEPYTSCQWRQENHATKLAQISPTRLVSYPAATTKGWCVGSGDETTTHQHICWFPIWDGMILLGAIIIIHMVTKSRAISDDGTSRTSPILT